MAPLIEPSKNCFYAASYVPLIERLRLARSRPSFSDSTTGELALFGGVSPLVVYFPDMESFYLYGFGLFLIILNIGDYSPYRTGALYERFSAVELLQSGLE